MALVLKDRVKETSATTGTGTVTLAGAVADYQAFSVIGDGNTTYYTIVLTGSDEWEVGLGTYTATGTTLSRDTVLASSNSGSLVNFSAGDKDVFVVYPAGKSVYADSNGDVDVSGEITGQEMTATPSRSPKPRRRKRRRGRRIGTDDPLIGDCVPADADSMARGQLAKRASCPRVDSR